MLAGDQAGQTTQIVSTDPLDFRMLFAMGAVALLVLLLFGIAIGWSGLLTFPSFSKGEDLTNFHYDALVFREKRLALALVFRTFLTGLSFVVGLAMCTQGGLFILRQVSSLTTFSLSNPVTTQVPPPPAAPVAGIPQDPAVDPAAADDLAAVSHRAPADVDPITSLGSRNGLLAALKDKQFAFSSYSPGVVFMLGGVLVMAFTQFLSIQIVSPEVEPPGWEGFVCRDEDQGLWLPCSTGQATVLPNEAAELQGAQDAAAP